MSMSPYKLYKLYAFDNLYNSHDLSNTSQKKHISLTWEFSDREILMATWNEIISLCLTVPLFQDYKILPPLNYLKSASKWLTPPIQ